MKTTFLGQLTGYSSSEEDEVGHNLEASGRPNVPQPESSASQQNVRLLPKYRLYFEWGCNDNFRLLTSLRQRAHPSGKIDHIPSTKNLHYTRTAKVNTTPEQHRGAIMASKTGSTTKRQDTSPILAMHRKRPRSGPFVQESSDEDSDSDNDSRKDDDEDEDDSVSQRNDDDNRKSKITRSVPMKARLPMPNGPPPPLDRKSVRDMRGLIAGMKNRIKNASNPLASNTQAGPITSNATLSSQMKSQMGGRQRASLQAPRSEPIVRQIEKRPLSKARQIQHPETPAPVRRSTTAPSGTFSRPSKAIPSTPLRSASSVSRDPEPLRQPTIKTHTNSTGKSRSSDVHITNRFSESDRGPVGDARKSAQPRGQVNTVSNILGDIRKNERKGESSVRQTTNTPVVPHKPSSQKSPVYKELYSPTFTTGASTSRRSQKEVIVEPRTEQAIMSKRAPGDAHGGRGSKPSVPMSRPPSYNSTAPMDRPHLTRPATAASAQKRKIDDVSNEPVHDQPSSKRPALSVAPPPRTARPAAQVSVQRNSTRVCTTNADGITESVPTHAPLETTPEVMKPTVVPGSSSSFQSSRQSSVSVPSARSSAPAAEAMASHNLEQQAKPRKSFEVPKSVAETSNATTSGNPPSRANSVAAENSTSRWEIRRSSSVTKPSHLDHDGRIAKSSTSAPHPKQDSKAPSGVRKTSSSTQKPLDITPAVRAPTTPSATIIDKEQNATSKLVGPGKHQQDVAPNITLEPHKENLKKEGKVLSDGADKSSKSSKDVSTPAQKAIPQSSVESRATDQGAFGPQPASCKMSDAGSPVDAQRSDRQKISVDPEAPSAADPKFVFDPELDANLLPTKNQTTKGKEPAETSIIPEILSVPAHDNTTNTDVASAIDLSTSAAIPQDAESFFEYSVLERFSRSTENVSPDDGMVLSSSCTNIEEANARAKRVFDYKCAQYQQHFAIHFSEAITKRDDNGCAQLVGTFAPVDQPSKQILLTVWVRRDRVSEFAGQTRKDVKFTSFISKTVYVLRLFKLSPIASESEKGDVAADSLRIHHPHSRTECYTTLAGANRAAKNLQIELSHEPKPSDLEKKWQAQNLSELNKKMMELEEASDGEEKCWKSKFNGSGRGSDKYELLVEKVGLCGPRNL